MLLNIAQIRSITLGAERIEEKSDGIHFSRFTQEQDALYSHRSEAQYLRSQSSSGIQFRFVTDSRTMHLQTNLLPGSNRSFFAFDIYVNGNKIGSLDNYDGKAMPPLYPSVQFPLGVFSKEFSLGDGEKEVCVYFPWSVKTVLKAFALDDGAFVKPVKPSKTMLCFGDSITQGYDAAYPSSKYITKLANMLDAQEYNKAIGGEIFFPELSATKESFVPDYITVAYGTNDHARCTKEEFLHNCTEFFRNIEKNYPDVPVFVITPIWCKTPGANKPLGEHKNLDTAIRAITAEFPNVTTIRGYDFVPHDEAFFADAHLHPNDAGFDHYFENLAKEIRTLL